MPVGVEVGRIARLEEQWGHAVADANGGGALDAETEVATVRSLCIISELAQTPAANMTDVAAKIGIVARDLRLHMGERLLALLLESAERDCLRMASVGVSSGA